MRLSPTIEATFPSPIQLSRRWLEGVAFPPDRPLINLSQAAPVEPPHPAIIEEIARAAREETGAHLYGPVLGMPELRAEIAARWSAHYGGGISADQVAITSGCNEAFCAAATVLAAPGDNLILPVPYYFNHVMHLTMTGIGMKWLPCGADMIPDPDSVESLIDARSRAIVLVSPNNPTGAEYPAEVIARFAQIARARGLALILDETYRDFHASCDRPHDLFADPDWSDVLVHLYSFSKAYRLTGHRVGAMVADARVLAQVEKYLDTVTICASQIGQRAALFGLRHLSGWVADERRAILERRRVVEAALASGPARLISTGAYFAFVDPGPHEASDALARRLVTEQSLLVLPGTMFTPEHDPLGRRSLRVAFANTDADGIRTFAQRLSVALSRP